MNFFGLSLIQKSYWWCLLMLFSLSLLLFLSLKLNVIPLVLQAKKKGLVMVNFFSYFLTCSNTSTVNDVVGNYISFFAPLPKPLVGLLQSLWPKASKSINQRSQKTRPKQWNSIGPVLSKSIEMGFILFYYIDWK